MTDMKLDPTLSSTCSSGGKGSAKNGAYNPFTQLVRSKGFIWISTDISYSNTHASEANEKDKSEENHAGMDGVGTTGGFAVATVSAVSAVGATVDAIGAAGSTSAASCMPVNETCFYWSHAGISFELSQLGRWDSTEQCVTSENGGTNAQSLSTVAESNIDNIKSCGWRGNQHLVKLSNDGACQEVVFIGIGISAKEQKEITSCLDGCLCK